jgi:RNA polymerase sigma-70 factor (ECF subfamily)
MQASCLFAETLLFWKNFRDVHQGLVIHMQMHVSNTEQAAQVRHEEFVMLLTASHSRLLCYLLSLLGRWHDAQDVLQRASLLMWQKFSTFQSGTDLMACASTICFYEAKSFLRTASRSPLRFDDKLLALLSSERVEDLNLHDQRVAALETCLNGLRAEERRLLDASCGAYGGIAALAAQLGRAPATLYNKLSQLRRLLAAGRLHVQQWMCPPVLGWCLSLWRRPLRTPS